MVMSSWAAREGGVGRSKIRIFAFGHGLDVGKRGKGRGQSEIVHHGEVLVEIAEQQDRQIQPGVVHREFGFLESLLLLRSIGSRRVPRRCAALRRRVPGSG